MNAQRKTLVGTSLVAAAIALPWYFTVYDTAAGKCNRGDLGACTVVLGRRAAEEAAAKASTQAEASAAAAARVKQEWEQLTAQQEQQAASHRSLSAKEQSLCARVGGEWSGVSGGVCRIDYRSRGDGQLYHFTVAFDSDGNITPFGPQNAEQCARWYGLGLTGYWHPDTDICSL